MNDFPIEISYPDPADTSIARLSMKVFRAGKALTLSPNGELFEFEISGDEAHQLLDVIMMDCAKRHRAGLHPYRESYQLPLDRTDSVQIDAEIAAEIAAALFCIIAQSDLGDLLDQHPAI